MTIIKIATPSIIPKNEKIEITFKNPSFFLGCKFLNEINEEKGRFCEDGFSYSSDKNKHFLSVDELKELIENHI